MTQQTSPKGLAFLEAHEGVVLKAYRCPAGIWTIGAGLTAASGVVKPKAGMVISRTEASNLLQQALRRNYEPAVRAALGPVKQNIFDGGGSFHFNTGAIGRASWVQALKLGDLAKVRSRLAEWRKGGGKVLPGLVRRRAEEADIIISNKWPAGIPSEMQQPTVAFAGIVISLTAKELAEVAAAFRELGYEPGPHSGKIRLDAVLAFQTKYGLLIDGKIGRSTLTSLQRELDARRASKQGATGLAAGGATAGGNEVVTPPAGDLPGSDLVGDPLVTWIGAGVGALAVVYLLYLGYQYRDLIAARVQNLSPRLAAFLRSF